MQLDDLVAEWLRKAQQDISSAKFLLDMVTRPLEIIGFHAQQAVEKGLKATIVSAGVAPPRTHDLVYLHQYCDHHAGIDFGKADLCARLTSYAVDQRYPSEAPLDETELLSDLDSADAFVREIGNKLAT